MKFTKRKLKRFYFFRKFLSKYYRFKLKLKYKVKIKGTGCYKFDKNIEGDNNEVFVDEGAFVDKASLFIRGNNNKLFIGKNCFIGPDCRFRLEGDNTIIYISDNTSATRKVEFCVQEDNREIFLGKDCMIANRVVIRTSDTHPITNTESNKRINYADDVYIGNHVWIAPNCKIMKGSKIADNCIIGSDSTITKKYDKENCLIVGRPAKIVRENINWERTLTYLK